MADSDFSVRAKIELDTRNFEKNMKDAQTSASDLSHHFKNFGTSTEKFFGKNGLSKSISSVTKSVTGLTAVISAEITVLNKLFKGVTQYSDVYRTQLQSELQLTAAIKNNPLVNGEASENLKNYASEMQKVSNYGDEKLLPMMAQLIASGRTEAETQKIIKTAIDLAATGTMSLETAVQQLNGTLNGNIGRLGMQNSELKNLTKEELQNGKAVDILAEKYKGLAQAGINTSTQLKNIKGDFQEAIGRFTLPTSELWNKFWAGFYTRGTNVINKLNEHFETRTTGKFLVDEIYSRAEYVKEINNLEDTIYDIMKDFSFLENTAKAMTDRQLADYIKYIKSLEGGTTEWQRRLRAKVEKEIKDRRIIIQSQQEEAKLTAEEAEKQKTLSDIIADAQKKIEAQVMNWEAVKEVTGEEIGLEERLKFYQDNLVDAIVASGGQLDANNDFYKEQLKIIGDIQKKITTPVDDTFVKKLLDLELKNLDDYSDRFHEIQLQRIADEEQGALRSAKTEEEKLNVSKYFNEERIAEDKRYTEAVIRHEKDIEEKRKEWTHKIIAAFAGVAAAGAKAAEGVAKGFSKAFESMQKMASKIVSVISNTFKAGYSALKKMTDFSIDDSLEALLKFEDAILTFFLETLPQLPQFLASAFQSVSTLLASLDSMINYDELEKTVNSIIELLTDNLPKAFSSAVNIFKKTFTAIGKSIQENAPEIVNAFGEMFFTVMEALPGIIDTLFSTVGELLSNLGKYLTENKERFETALKNIVTTIINSISDFIKNGGWKNLLNGILAIQQAIENAVADNIEEIGETIVSLLPDLMEFLKKSIVSASKTLGKIAPTLLKIVVEVITGIIDVITSDEVVESSFDAIEGLIEGLVPAVVKLLTKVIPQLIEFSLLKLPSYIPMIITHVITGLVKGFAETDWLEVISDIFQGFVDAFKDFFGIHSPSTLFEGFGLNIIEGFNLGLQGFADAVKTILEPIFDFINNGFDKVLDTLIDLTKVSFEGLNDGLGKVLDSVKAILNPADSIKATFDGIKTVISSVSDLMKVSAKITISTLGAVVKAVADVHNTLRDVIKSVTAIKVWTPWETYEIGGVDIGKVKSPDISSYLNLVDKLATGTNNARKGLTLVGEAGPELVNFRGGEQVYNNHNTEKMLANTGGTTINQNVVFNNLQDTTAFAMMQQLKAYNRQMAINSVI